MMKSILAVLLIALPCFSQTGGVTGKSSGVALQQQTPGNDQNGNFHVNGTGIIDYSLSCYGPPYNLYADTSNLFFGNNYSFSNNGKDYGYGIFIGNNQSIVPNVTYGSQLGVLIGDQATCTQGGGVGIGWQVITGEVSGGSGQSVPCVAVGAYSAARGIGSITVGPYCTDTAVAANNDDGSILIGNQISNVDTVNHGSQWGDNVIIGNKINSSEAKLMIDIQAEFNTSGATQNRTVSDSNHIYLGSSTQTAFQAMGVDMTPATGTFTPTWVNLTQVPGTGSITITAGYYKVGSICSFWVKIAITGNATTTSAGGGSTYISNMPFTAAHGGAGFCSTATANLGACELPEGTTICNSNTWSAANYSIWLTGQYLTN